jgi:hypothetical protein
LGVVLLTGLAFAGYVVLGQADDPPATASAAPSSAPAPSAVTAAPPPAPSASSGPAKARFTCQPEACEWVVCDGKNVTGIGEDVELAPGSHECSASKNGFASKALTFEAVPGQVSPVLFELSPLPPPAPKAVAPAAPKAAVPTAPASKPAAAAPAAKPAAAKPTAAAPAAKPATTTTKPKKKCSTFLGCK